MNLKLGQSRPCIWSVDKMYTIFLLVAITASLFPGTVQLHCCIPSQLETYVDELSFVPGGRGSTVLQVSTCVFSKLFTTLTFFTCKHCNVFLLFLHLLVDFFLLFDNVIIFSLLSIIQSTCYYLLMIYDQITM